MFAACIDGEYRIARSSELAETGRIYHVVGSYDGEILKLYIDGEKVAEYAVNGSIDTPVVQEMGPMAGIDVALMLGSNPCGTSGTIEFLDGKIYLDKVYNGVMFDTVVAKKYNEAMASIGTNVINLYNPLHNGGANVYSSSATEFVDLMGNNNGRLGGTKWEEGGYVEDSALIPQWQDGALVFDGNVDGNTISNGDPTGYGGYVALETRNKVHPTVEAVFELDSIEYEEQHIISNVEAGGYALIANYGYLQMVAYIDGAYRIVRSNTPMEVGRKYHAIGSYDGEKIKLYVDGEKVGESSIAGSIGEPAPSGSGTATVLMLGSNPCGDRGTLFFLDGKIYLAKVYDGGLTDAQAYQQYLFAKKSVSMGNHYQLISPTLAKSVDWYNQGGTTIPRSSVTLIDVKDSYIPTEYVEKWDASEGRKGTVMAYLEDDGLGNNTYKLTLAGSEAGKIYANENSNGTFCAFDNATAITGLKDEAGNVVFDTSKVVNMEFMFGQCNKYAFNI